MKRGPEPVACQCRVQLVRAAGSPIGVEGCLYSKVGRDRWTGWIEIEVAVLF